MYCFVDVEANGPCPGIYSMAKLGCVILRPNGDTSTRFYATFRPINDNYLSDAYKHSAMTREEHLTFDDPSTSMIMFNDFLKKNILTKRKIFISDNLAFDWQFVNYYFHRYIGENPFGHSGRRINDIYSGTVKDLRASNKWKNFRVTPHDHNPVNDALGNAEAFWTICNKFGIPYK